MNLKIDFFGCDETYKKDVIVFCSDFESKKNRFVFKTSGSTGVPQNIEVEYNQLISSAKATIDTLAIKSGKTALVCLNTGFTAGKMMLVRCMVADMHALVVPASAFPFDEIKNLFSGNIHFAAFVPYQIKMMISRNDFLDIMILKNIETIIIGGEPLDSETEKLLFDINPNCYVTFGMTETLSHFALRKIGSKPNHYHLLNNTEIGVDERNCLKVRNETSLNQWVQSNDIVNLTENEKGVVDGFEWIGRIDNVINSAGVKINIEQMEMALLPILNEVGVKEYFVYKQPDSLFGETAVLYIKKQPLHIYSEAEILDVISKKADNKYYKPKKVFFLDEFVYTSTNKINRGLTASVY